MALGKFRIQDKSWNYFTDIDIFFDSFGFYVKEVNQLINNEIALAKESYDKFLIEVKKDPTWDMEWPENYLNVQAKIGLTNIYYDSLIMAMYSFIESKMLFLCKYLSQGQNIKVNDMADRGIIKYQKYLSKVCGIDFSPINNEWETLLGYNKLRNHLVHSDGNRSIPVSNKKLIQFLRSIKGISLLKSKDSYVLDFTTDDIIRNFITATKIIIDHLYIEKR